MIIIPIDGVIGSEVTSKFVREALNKANGQPVTIQVSSIGGSVPEGLTIYNLIKGYKGEISTEIIGASASMGSFIAMATEKVTAAKNSFFMIHNAMSVAFGNHNELRATADTLESFSELLSNVYTERTGKSREEVKNLMDDETFFFGEEIVQAGFADSVFDSDDDAVAESKEEIVAFARLQLEECSAKLKREEKTEDFKKVAALLNIEARVNAPPQPKQKVKMTEAEMQAKLEEQEAKHKAELAEAKATTDEPAAKDEPKEIESHEKKALTILQSEAYSPEVKKNAASVIEASVDKKSTEYIIAAASFNTAVGMADSQIAKEASDLAKAETEKLGETKGAQGEPDPLADGIAKDVNGLKALSAKLNPKKEAK